MTAMVNCSSLLGFEVLPMVFSSLWFFGCLKLGPLMGTSSNLYKKNG